MIKLIFVLFFSLIPFFFGGGMDPWLPGGAPGVLPLADELWPQAQLSQDLLLKSAECILSQVWVVSVLLAVRPFRGA